MDSIDTETQCEFMFTTAYWPFARRCKENFTQIREVTISYGEVEEMKLCTRHNAEADRFIDE